ncbi:arylsulfatase [Spongiimicrobium sp. 3-5]|uniref:arylsulfatase n=1 Tax=Spongiimicrobium sp. 3-5 TaxID=3332596 RepID=UPI00397ED607
MNALSKLIGALLCIILLTYCKNPKTEIVNTEIKKPNIVLILADDQGWGDLSIHGNTNLATPNIDAIAQNGAAFENFFVQPVCSPTRAELLTGRYFGRSGVYATSAGGERMNLGEVTLAEILQDAGYTTAAYGKWHNGMQPPYHPNARGFQDFYGFCSGHWGNYFSPMLEHNGEIVTGNGFLVDDLTDKGLNFIERNKEVPFFLYLPLNTPHSPMQVPDAYWDRFKNKPLALGYKDSIKEDVGFTRAALAMVENIDHNVGRVSEKLKTLGLEENTIVIYLSDNGPNSWRWNGSMRGKKGSTDEGGVKSPFFIQWKNVIKSGTKLNTIAASIDLLPTLAHLAHIDLKEPQRLDGKDLAPLLLGSNTKVEPRVVYNHWEDSTSLRTQKYRLDHKNRLYDMEADVGQTEDIAANLPKFRDSLIALKNSWRANVMDKNKTHGERRFTVGHPDFIYTQLPARDGIAHGNITRSNKYPNDSFFSEWNSTNDAVTWNIEVLEDGIFEVALYYTCKPENKGTQLKLEFGDHQIHYTVEKTHDPPLKGMENDRFPRAESYVKDFISANIGELTLKKGSGTLKLSAIKIPGDQAIDFRLLQLKKL